MNSVAEWRDRMTDVTIEYFAVARELSGCSKESVALPRSPMAVREVLGMLALRHPLLSNVIHRMRLAVNGEIAGDEGLVRAGDQIAVLPPVAGGAGAGADEPGHRPDHAPVLCAVRETPLSVDEIISALQAPEVGGITVFIGTVRNHADDKPVARLDYEAHPVLAVQEMRRICDEVLRTHPGTRLAVVHRTGSLAVGDLAIIVGAGAAHRADAFDACRDAVEQIKARVPIWKKEWSPDGSAGWVNL
jgi:molybdopterin synthase catalytic subunit